MRYKFSVKRLIKRKRFFSNPQIDARFEELEELLLASPPIRALRNDRRVGFLKLEEGKYPLFTKRKPPSFSLSLELCVNYLSKIGGVERRVKRCTRPTEPTESDTR